VLRELRRVPRGFATFLVVGGATVTMIVFAAFDTSVDRSVPAQVKATAQHAAPRVAALGGGYPKAARKPDAAAPAEQEPAAPAAVRIPLRRLVGQRLMVRITGTSASSALLRRVRRGEVGGVIVFPDNVGSRAQLKALTGRLTRAARAGGSSGFLIAVDLEGGTVKRLAAGPPYQSPAQIATAAAGEREGAATGAYLAGLGINVDLAPVLDVARPGSFVASRAFAHTPARVAELGGAFAAGLEQGGVAATAKHFPGLGHATVNTDRTPSVVGASRAVLDADLAPFGTAIANRVPLVMMSNASYPAYAPGPAVLSSAVVQGQLRGKLGFGGVIISDDLDAGAIRAVMSPGSAAVAAAKAGVDVLLLARTEGSAAPAYQALLGAARSGRLDRAALEGSYQRIQQLEANYAR
jgi:beta-N-acetylhexosaminidase